MRIEPKKDGTYCNATIKAIEELSLENIRKMSAMQIYTIFQGLVNTINKRKIK